MSLYRKIFSLSKSVNPGFINMRPESVKLALLFFGSMRLPTFLNITTVQTLKAERTTKYIVMQDGNKMSRLFLMPSLQSHFAKSGKSK